MTLSLLQRVAAEDTTAMQECMREYAGLVWSLARRAFVSRADAEDAVQDAFIAIWENAGRFDPDSGSEVTFVAMIARRRIIDRIRSAGRKQRLLDEAADQARAVGGDRAAPSSRWLETDEDVQRVRVALNQLSDAQREVLRLALFYNCTHEQIAGQTGQPLGTVKTNIRRGMQRLRTLVQQDQPAPMTTGGVAS